MLFSKHANNQLINESMKYTYENEWRVVKFACIFSFIEKQKKGKSISIRIGIEIKQKKKESKEIILAYE